MEHRNSDPVLPDGRNWYSFVDTDLIALAKPVPNTIRPPLEIERRPPSICLSRSESRFVQVMRHAADMAVIRSATTADHAQFR